MKSEVEWEVYVVEGGYVDYEVKMGKGIMEVLRRGKGENEWKGGEMCVGKRDLEKVVEEVLSERGKKIVGERNEIEFEEEGEILSGYEVCWGEKEMVVMVVRVLVEENEGCRVFMEEGEM